MSNVTSSMLVITTDDVKDFSSNLSSNITADGNVDMCSRHIKRRNEDEIIKIVTQIVIAFLMLGLGCTTEFKLMCKYIKAPKQILTGLVLQLVFLPLWGLTLSQIFVMSEAETMGAIIQASCPGGVYSNLASYWLDGDMDLSIVLTSFSTILAMGTLPFWLFVLPEIKQIENECLKVPFDVLGFTLLQIIGPVIVGLLIKWKFPKVAYILTKVCSIIGSIAVIGIVAAISIIQGPFMFSSINWKTITFSIMLPLTASICGYLAARVPWLTVSVPARRTIAIETFMQNSALAITIVLVSYNVTSSNFGPIIIVPFLYGIIQLGSTLIIVIIYLVTKYTGHCKWIHIEEEKESDKC